MNETGGWLEGTELLLRESVWLVPQIRSTDVALNRLVFLNIWDGLLISIFQFGVEFTNHMSFHKYRMLSKGWRCCCQLPLLRQWVLVAFYHMSFKRHWLPRDPLNMFDLFRIDHVGRQMIGTAVKRYIYGMCVANHIIVGSCGLVNYLCICHPLLRWALTSRMMISVLLWMPIRLWPREISHQTIHH